MKQATLPICFQDGEGYFAPHPKTNKKKYRDNFYISEQPVVGRVRRGSLVKMTQMTQLHPGSSNSPTTHTPLRKLCKCFWKHANATFQFPDFNPPIAKRRRTLKCNMMGGRLPLEATPRPGRPAPQSLAMPFPHQQCAVLGCGFRADKPPRAQDTFELLHSSSAQLRPREGAVLQQEMV